MEPERSTALQHHFSRLLRLPWLEMAYSYLPRSIGQEYYFQSPIYTRGPWTHKYLFTYIDAFVKFFFFFEWERRVNWVMSNVMRISDKLNFRCYLRVWAKGGPVATCYWYKVECLLISENQTDCLRLNCRHKKFTILLCSKLSN